MHPTARNFATELVRQVLLKLSFMIGAWVAQVSRLYDFIQRIVSEIVKGYANVIDHAA